MSRQSFGQTDYSDAYESEWGKAPEPAKCHSWCNYRCLYSVSGGWPELNPPVNPPQFRDCCVPVNHDESTYYEDMEAATDWTIAGNNWRASLLEMLSTPSGQRGAKDVLWVRCKHHDENTYTCSNNPILFSDPERAQCARCAHSMHTECQLPILNENNNVGGIFCADCYADVVVEMAAEVEAAAAAAAEVIVVD